MGDTVTWPSADGAADSVTPVPTPPRSLPAAFSAGAGVGVLVGLIGLGGAEFPAAADRAVPVPRSPSPPGWPRCPIDTLVDYWFVVVNLLAGSLIGAWIGATWATRMRSATIYRVLATLLALIAAVLAWSHFGHLDPITIQPVPRAIIGVLVGIGVVAALMGFAGGELLIPTIVLLFAVDIKIAGSLSPVTIAAQRLDDPGSFGAAGIGIDDHLACFGTKWSRLPSC